MKAYKDKPPVPSKLDPRLVSRVLCKWPMRDQKRCSHETTDKDPMAILNMIMQMMSGQGRQKKSEPEITLLGNGQRQENDQQLMPHPKRAKVMSLKDAADLTMNQLSGSAVIPVLPSRDTNPELAQDAHTMMPRQKAASSEDIFLIYIIIVINYVYLLLLFLFLLPIL